MTGGWFTLDDLDGHLQSATPTSQRTRHCAFHGSARSTVFRGDFDRLGRSEHLQGKPRIIFRRKCGKIPIGPLSNSGRYGSDRQNTMVGYNHNGTTSARIVGWRDPNIKLIIEPANPAMNFGWQPMLINYWSWEQDSQSWA